MAIGVRAVIWIDSFKPPVEIHAKRNKKIPSIEIILTTLKNARMAEEPALQKRNGARIKTCNRRLVLSTQGQKVGVHQANFYLLLSTSTSNMR